MLLKSVRELLTPVSHMASFWTTGAVTALIGAALAVSLIWLGVQLETDASADKVLKETSELLTDVGNVLRDAATQTNPAEVCEADNLKRLRRLVFDSAVVRDIGVLPDTVTLQCTTTLGMLRGTRISIPYDLETPAGWRIWLSSPVRVARDRKGIIIQIGIYNAVVDMQWLGDLYHDENRSAALIFRPKDSRHILVRGTLQPDVEHALTTTHAGGGETRFLAPSLATVVQRCRDDIPICGIAAADLPAALRAGVPFILLSAITGLVAGSVLFGLGARQMRNVLGGSMRLRRALRRNELSLAYQPQVDLHTRRILGCEALLRGPGGGSAEIPLGWARDADDMEQIACFAIRRCMQDIGDWLRDNPGTQVSLNFEASDFRGNQVADLLNREVAQAGINPHQIVLEIVERDEWDNPLVVGRIHELRRQGFRLALDDFGTGYSNVSKLDSSAVDIIKVDRSFVDSVGKNPVVSSMLDALLFLTREIGKDLLIEGIETEEQAAYCRARCQSAKAQGWLFGRPVSPAAFLDLVGAPRPKGAVRGPASVSTAGT